MTLMRKQVRLTLLLEMIVRSLKSILRQRLRDCSRGSQVRKSCVSEWVGGRMDGWLGGWVSGWMNGRMGEWSLTWGSICFPPPDKPIWVCFAQKKEEHLPLPHTLCLFLSPLLTHRLVVHHFRIIHPLTTYHRRRVDQGSITHKPKHTPTHTHLPHITPHTARASSWAAFGSSQKGAERISPGVACDDMTSPL